MGETRQYEVMGSGGDVVGPVSEELVAKAIAAGRIPDDARYRLAGASEWSPIGEFPGMGSSEPAAAASPDPAHTDGDVTTLIGADFQAARVNPPAPMPTGVAPRAAYTDPRAPYASAYAASGAIEGLGMLFKIGAVFAGLLGVGIGLSADHIAIGATFVLGGLGVAVALAAFGLLWSALGQILRATLDTAVHTRVLAIHAGWDPPR